MPIHLQLLPDEPILIASVQGSVAVDDMVQMFHDSAALIESIEGTVYRITDTILMTAAFAELLAAVHAASSGVPGSPTDPRIQSVLAGQTYYAKFASDVMRLEQTSSLNLPIFPTVADALAAIRLSLAADRSAHN